MWKNYDGKEHENEKKYKLSECSQISTDFFLYSPSYYEKPVARSPSDSHTRRWWWLHTMYGNSEFNITKTMIKKKYIYEHSGIVVKIFLIHRRNFPFAVFLCRFCVFSAPDPIYNRHKSISDLMRRMMRMWKMCLLSNFRKSLHNNVWRFSLLNSLPLFFWLGNIQFGRKYFPMGLNGVFFQPFKQFLWRWLCLVFAYGRVRGGFWIIVKRDLGERWEFIESFFIDVERSIRRENRGKFVFDIKKKIWKMIKKFVHCAIFSLANKQKRKVEIF